MTDRPDLDERFEELVRRVAETSAVPPPAAIRGRARRHLAGQGAAALLLAAALVVAGLAVDRRIGAEPAPVGPAAPLTATPPTTAAPGARQVPGPAAAPQPGPDLGGGTVIASGTSPKGMRYRLTARIVPGRGLCESFTVAAPGEPLDRAGGAAGCSGPESKVNVSYEEQGGPGSRPAVPEVAVAGEVKGPAGTVRLTLKRTPRDHRSPVARTVTVRTIHKPGFRVAFFVAFIPVDTWVAKVTLLDANGRRICSQLGDDFKTPYLPGAMRCT